jgi:hypothetical protein
VQHEIQAVDTLPSPHHQVAPGGIEHRRFAVRLVGEVGVTILEDGEPIRALGHRKKERPRAGQHEEVDRLAGRTPRENHHQGVSTVDGRRHVPLQQGQCLDADQIVFKVAKHTAGAREDHPQRHQ